MDKKKLTKMSGENIDLNNLYKKSSFIVKTIDVFEINIKYNENPFYLIYENKRQIKDILRILRDSYYVSTINLNPGIDSKLVDTGGNKKSK